MAEKHLKRLNIYLENELGEDIIIIFAEPNQKDVCQLIRDQGVLDHVNQILWANDDNLEGRIDKVENDSNEKEDKMKHCENVWIEAWNNEMKRRNKESHCQAKENSDDLQDSVKEEINEDYKVENVEAVITEDVEDDGECNDHVDKVEDMMINKKEDIHDYSVDDKVEHPLKAKKDSIIYFCDICNKSFTQKAYLTRHKKIHESDKPFACDNCGKKFIQKSDLRQHKRIHTGEKPYSCEVCGGSFTTSSYLAKHIRIHTGERNYSCDICKKAFNQKGDLTIHKRTHTGEKPFLCTTCGSAYSTKSRLTDHMRRHVGDKRYACDLCEKTFIDKYGLTVHQRIHTGDKPYSCDYCGKDFSQGQHLKRHKKICAVIKQNSD